jgi:hypothetical protein
MRDGSLLRRGGEKTCASATPSAAARPQNSRSSSLRERDSDPSVARLYSSSGATPIRNARSRPGFAERGSADARRSQAARRREERVDADHAGGTERDPGERRPCGRGREDRRQGRGDEPEIPHDRDPPEVHAGLEQQDEPRGEHRRAVAERAVERRHQDPGRERHQQENPDVENRVERVLARPRRRSRQRPRGAPETRGDSASERLAPPEVRLAVRRSASRGMLGASPRTPHRRGTPCRGGDRRRRSGTRTGRSRDTSCCGGRDPARRSQPPAT